MSDVRNGKRCPQAGLTPGAKRPQKRETGKPASPSSVVRRDQGAAGDMGDWVIDEAE